MGWRLKSLSEDAIDTYSHTWSVLALLLLALLTLVVPSRLTPESPAEYHHHYHYTASCWCPAQFVDSMVEYTNAVCSAALNAVIRGEDFRPARIFDYNSGPMNTYATPAPVAKNNDSQSGGGDGDGKEGVHDGRGGKSMVMNTPVVLFVLAICLRLPQMIWSILSGWANCVNVDQTLQSAAKGDSMDADGRRQLYAGLIRAFLGYTQPRRTTSVYLYLLMKLMTISIIVAEIISVVNVILPVIQGTKDGGQINKEEMTSTSSSPGDEPEVDGALNPVFPCFFPVRMTSLHHYTVQCIFRRHPAAGDTVLEITYSTLTNIYTAVLSSLVILAVANVLNTTAWLFNLCGQSSGKRMGLNKTAPLDLVFLVEMARRNLSIGAAWGLAETAGLDSKVDKGEEME